MKPDGTGTDAKACCADAYSSDVVAMLLGDSYHPGGLALTRDLAARLRLGRGHRVLDVACGRGAGARAIAAEHPVVVDGVDLSVANTAAANGAATASGLAGRARFTVGDAESLPFGDGVFDAVVCECAWCTFPGKPTAAAEFARVLKPGGRLGITDVTADRARLPGELSGPAARIACVAGAESLDGYARLLRGAGFGIVHTERRDEALKRMIDRIEARLSFVRLTARDRAERLGVDFGAAPRVLGAARAAVAAGIVGYALVVAAKPRQGRDRSG